MYMCTSGNKSCTNTVKDAIRCHKCNHCDITRSETRSVQCAKYATKIKVAIQAAGRFSSHGGRASSKPSRKSTTKPGGIGSLEKCRKCGKEGHREVLCPSGASGGAAKSVH